MTCGPAFIADKCQLRTYSAAVVARIICSRSYLLSLRGHYHISHRPISITAAVGGKACIATGAALLSFAYTLLIGRCACACCVKMALPPELDAVAAAPLPVHRRTPRFCIIGAQKAGTTSMYDLLCRHPLVVPGRRKEPHFLDWRWNPHGCVEGALAADAEAASAEGSRCTDPSGPEDGNTTAAADIEGLQRQWAMYFDGAQLSANPDLVSGDATPSYLLNGELSARRMRALAPDVRLVVMLREPVERAYSHYRMCADTRGSTEQLRNRGHEHVRGLSFEEVVAEDMAALEAAGVSPPPPNLLGTAIEPDQQQKDGWAEGPDNAMEAYLREGGRLLSTHGAHSFVGRGLYVLQLLPWLKLFGPLHHGDDDCGDDNGDESGHGHLLGDGKPTAATPTRDDERTTGRGGGGGAGGQVMVVLLEDLASPALARATMARVLAFVGLPVTHEFLDAAYLHDSGASARSNARAADVAMAPETRARLEAYYAPHNEALARLLHRGDGDGGNSGSAFWDYGSRKE